MHLIRLILRKTTKPAPAYRWCAEQTAPGLFRVSQVRP